MKIQNSMQPVGFDETFGFLCGPHVECFNSCCRDLNQFLTPYDVLRLARHLEMVTGDFLQTYTMHYPGPETGLPVVSLKPEGQSDKKCPFVTSEGCTVYENRPGSCRMYPLARMLSRSRQTGALTESYVLIYEPHCRGFDQSKGQSVRQWVADQGLNPYNEANDAMIEVISVKQQALPGPLKEELAQKLFKALYDLDAFRHAFAGTVEPDCRKLGLDTDSLLLDDDSALLCFAMKYAAEILQHASSLDSRTK